MRAIVIALSILAGLLTPARADHASRVALVVGNSKYLSVAALPNPRRDAEAVARTLEMDGFSVTLVRDATRAQMINALKDYRDQVSQADWALVYYAGHGLEVGGVNYLVPTDAVLKDDRDTPDEAIPLSRVLDTVDSAKKIRIVLLDACRNNPFEASMKRSIPTRSVNRGLSPPEPQAGVMVVYSAAAGNVAEDGSGRNSPFTSALVSRLKEPGLEVNRLFNVVTADVMRTTDQRQRPYLYGSNPSEEEFFFVPKGPQLSSDQSVPTTSDEDSKVWDLLRNSRDMTVLRTFRGNLPAGSEMRKDVDERIASLEAEILAGPPNRSDHPLPKQPVGNNNSDAGPRKLSKATKPRRDQERASREAGSRKQRATFRHQEETVIKASKVAPPKVVATTRHCFMFNGRSQCEM